MKIRSLLLGSVAAAGLTTAGYATDLGVVTSLNVCDELGLSGLTISSDDNCLVITGGVTYEFKWGSYAFNNGNGLPIYTNNIGNEYTVDVDNGNLDVSSDVDAWLQFQATADSSFGPASATIKLLSENSSYDVLVDKAYVSIGDTTMLTAGKASSIFKDGDDAPLNFLGLFHSQGIDSGVGFANGVDTGGDVIQLVSDLGNGVWIGGALENLSGDYYGAGGTASSTGVGVISYSGDGLTAHASLAVEDILSGSIGLWNLHTGFTGTFDNFKLVGALATESSGWWNVLGSASATFDMFTLAVSGEATAGNEWGVGGSIAGTVSDGVTFNLGGRYFTDSGPNTYIMQAAAQIVAAVSDDVTLTGEIGAISDGANTSNGADDLFYAKGTAAWAPGGGVDASVSGQVNTYGGWQTDFKISKSIK